MEYRGQTPWNQSETEPSFKKSWSIQVLFRRRTEVKEYHRCYFWKLRSTLRLPFDTHSSICKSMHSQCLVLHPYLLSQRIATPNS